MNALRREMSATDGLLVTLAGLSPSIGVFIVGSDVIHMVGSGAVLCFLAAVVLGIAMASVYAELGSCMPSAGGEYTIAGRLLGPDAGFAMLSINLCGLCLAMSLSSLGVAGYLQAVLPGLPVLPTALGLVVAVTALAMLSLHAVPLAMLGVGAAGGIYAFNGYGSVIFFSEEIRDARRSVAAIVYGSLAIAAVTELVPMAGIVMGAPDLAGLAGAPAPVARFIGQAGGPVLARIMSLAVAAAIFNTMIAIMLSAGRQLYASARDNAWPAGGRHLAALHPRFGSPHLATLAVGAAALACCLVPAGVLVTILANGNVATYATLCLAAIAGRRSGLTADSQARAPLFPLGPVFVLLALGGVIWADLLDPATGAPGLLAMLAIVGLGVGVHRLVVRGNPAWEASKQGLLF